MHAVLSRIGLLAIVLGTLYPRTVLTHDDRDTREIRLAEASLLLALIDGRSQEGLARCERRSLGCCFDRADLALIVVGNKDSTAAHAALAAFVRFRLDGALSEQFHCYVLAKGKPLLKHLRSLKPADLFARCQREVNDAKKSVPGIAEVELGAICAEQRAVEAHLKEIHSAIAAGRKCAAEDF